MSIRAKWQFAIWTGYGVLMLVMLRQYSPLSSAIVLITVCVVCGLCGASEFLRALVLWRNWLERPAWVLALRIGIAVPFLALAVQLACAAVVSGALRFGLVGFAPGERNPGLGAYVAYVANTSIVLWLWAGAWSSRQFLMRWRSGEIRHWQAVAQQHQLELELLRARINPHFVFNALNNLRALILEDPARARDMATRLSNALRYTLVHSQRTEVCVSEEVKLVRDYIALQKVHHEERLQVCWDVAPDTMDCKLPPMALQVLVENAIKHGIARTPGGGTLAITLRRSDSGQRPALDVVVSNPGHWQPSSDEGIGLRNLRAQLRLLGGPEAACTTSEAGDTVTVHLHLPQ